MITGPDFATWLADPAAHDKSLDATNRFARFAERHPLLMDLNRQVAELQAPSAAAVQAIAERFLERTDEIDALIGSIIEAAAADPYFRPPFQQSNSEVSSGLALYDEPALWVAAGVTRVDDVAQWKIGPTGPASIGFTGYVTIFKFIKAGGATLSLWEAPEAQGDFGAHRSGRCRFVGRRAIADGDRLVMDGRRQSFVFEHATTDIVHLQAQVRLEAAPLAVEYDADSFTFVGASSTDEASSRTQMMVTLLRMMDRSDAAPIIEQALQSPHFYTRWHVMREYLALDADAALPSLRRMAVADPHPEVRTAASQTLAALFGQDEGEEETLQCRA